MTVKQKIVCGMAGCIVVLYLVVRFLYPAYNSLLAQRSPVVSLEAENRKVYKRTMAIREKDFTVTAVHENGKKTRLRSEEYSLSATEPALTGDKTDIRIILKENKDIQCKCSVKNDRKPIVRFYCGRENLKDAVAVLYSNGELCFEGKGDILAFNEYPWKEYEDMDEHPLISVTFTKDIRPESMDDWFSGIDTLAYVSAIPSSVKSMSSAFSECSSLKKGTDWSRCDSLINVSECYKGCESLSEFTDLPASVIIADHMCEGCISLEKTGNLSKAVNLKSAVSMYQGCTNIIEAGISPNVETIAYAYAGCINLKSMPLIPETVKAMEGCFEGDISLQHLTNLPANVVNISSCFSGCSKIEGNLMIDCNPVEYSNLFLGAAVATKVHLAGKSNIINELIDECNNDNISVAE